MAQAVHVIDVETTGLDPDADAIVEIAAVRVELSPEPKVGALVLDTLVNPRRKIPAPARAIHHISNAMVANAPGFEQVRPQLAELADEGPFCAHSAAFDKAFTGSGRPWICTFRLARHLWPNAPGHGNQVLRYHHELDVPEAHTALGERSPHRAAPDALVTAMLLVHAFSLAPKGTDLVAWAQDLSGQPALLPRATFGKHRGLHWADVPRDYIRYMAEQPLDDEDVRYTLRCALEGLYAERDADDEGPFDES